MTEACSQARPAAISRDAIPPHMMALSCPKVQLTETLLPTILLNVSDYSHTEKGSRTGAGGTRQKIQEATARLLQMKGLSVCSQFPMDSQRTASQIREKEIHVTWQKPIVSTHLCA
jgi:hypothetical protein